MDSAQQDSYVSTAEDSGSNFSVQSSYLEYHIYHYWSNVNNQHVPIENLTFIDIIL